MWVVLFIFFAVCSAYAYGRSVEAHNTRYHKLRFALLEAASNALRDDVRAAVAELRSRSQSEEDLEIINQIRMP
jgi:tRNA G10  N-methylase Trm11